MVKIMEFKVICKLTDKISENLLAYLIAGPRFEPAISHTQNSGANDSAFDIWFSVTVILICIFPFDI